MDHYAAAIINQTKSIEVELIGVHNMHQKAKVFNNKARAEVAEAKSKAQAVETEMACLKKALKGAKASKAKAEAYLDLEKKKWGKARSKVAKIFLKKFGGPELDLGFLDEKDDEEEGEAKGGAKGGLASVEANQEGGLAPLIEEEPTERHSKFAPALGEKC
ncbi:hypothetical protein COCNU_08G000850 [Cocos nucifera]|uniref:Uncharacterized protein n=1 Tax=Cocos nucifera TaxID=13894 RepID=A0A8K0IGP8_COCNU|nr:hypothetical protein COCNU_08G000850 [Cocos nucifera]